MKYKKEEDNTERAQQVPDSGHKVVGGDDTEILQPRMLTLESIRLSLDYAVSMAWSKSSYCTCMNI